LYFRQSDETVTRMVLVKPTDTVKSFWTKIEKVAGYPLPYDSTRIFCNGYRLINESKTLADYNVEQDSFISVVPRMLGGGS